MLYKKILFGNLLVTSLVFSTFSFVGCSTGDENLQHISNSEEFSSDKFSRSYSIDTLFIVNESKNAMVSFTESVKEYYIIGMTYDDLKKAIDPNTALKNITKIGDELLLDAYENIRDDISYKNINGIKILSALQAIVQHDIDTNGITEIHDFDFSTGEQWLFGLDDLYEAQYKKCRWYQVGCHLSNVWEWLNTKAPGNGGKTNGEVLAEVLKMLSLFL